MADDGADQFPELGSVYRVSDFRNRQLQSISDGSAPRPCYSQNYRPNAWGDPNVIQKLKLAKWGNDGSRVANTNNPQDKRNFSDALACRGSGILNDSKLPPQSEISPTLEKGLDISVGIDTTTSKDCEHGPCKDEKIPEPHPENNDDEIVDSESGIVFDSDDDCSLDDTDSDTGEKSHEGCKKSKWLKNFFEKLNALTTEEISSQEMQWHCPACQGGPGAIDWYKGLQPLLYHSRTIQSRRARLHRMFAETLEEECCRRRATLTMVGEAHDIWEGLDKKVKDHEIIWPPMVIIMNTRCEQDDNNKWYGMGNQELLDCFSDYAALKARHSYGPQGHRGMSYLEALRLHKHFKEQGRDREAWDRCQNPYLPGGKRQLYGYLAYEKDLDIFNRHSGGKSKLKFEMRSYQEMVESNIKHINDDSRKLDYYKSMMANEQIKSQVCADSVCNLSKKLSQNCIEQQNEMDFQEKNFQDQIQVIQQAIAAKEDKFAKLQQAEQEIVEESRGESSEKEDKVKNISSFLKPQDKEMKQLEAERAKIIEIYEEKKLVLNKKLVELEQQLQNELTQLLDKYTSNQSQEENCQK
ncbi:Protein SUPPRESSOR OF protein SILENCING 3, partial [Mucuna pruriens]